MLTLPRSPAVKLVIGLLAVLCLIGYTLQYSSVAQLEHHSSRDAQGQQEATREYRTKQQQQQQQQHQQEAQDQYLPKPPAEEPKKRVPLSTFQAWPIFQKC